MASNSYDYVVIVLHCMENIPIFNINNYYDEISNVILKAVDEGFFKKAHLDIFKISDNAEELLNYIEGK